MRVDYFTGYPVESVSRPNKPKDGSWKFCVTLEGGGKIRFYKTEPPEKDTDIAGSTNRKKSILAVKNNYDGSIEVTFGRVLKMGDPPVDVFTVQAPKDGYSVTQAEDPDVEWWPMEAVKAAGDDIPPEPVERLQEALQGSREEALELSASQEAQNGSGGDETAEVGEDAS